MIYDLPNEDDDEEMADKTLYKKVTKATKISLQYINGDEAHLNQIKAIAENNGENAVELQLIFVGNHKVREVAKSYVNVFRMFKNIEKLNIKTYFGDGDGNLTNIVEIMSEEEDFPWFKSVKILKCYEINMIDTKESLQKFYTMFKNLTTIKGIYWNDFNPFSKF